MIIVERLRNRITAWRASNNARTRPAAWLAVLLMAAAPMAAASAGDAGRGAAIEPVPVLDTDFPDPFILPVRHGLLAFATNSVRDGLRLNVQLSRSADGVQWSAPVDAMPTLPAWARTDTPDIWAPEVMRVGRSYVLYFSARHARLRRPDGLTLCVGAAVAERPEGPYRPLDTPLSCGGRDGVIDASPVRDGAGRLWLYMKTDGNCCGAPIRLLALSLSADGLGASGPARVVYGFTNDRPWEGKVVEAPQMVRTPAGWRLFYSANDYGGRAYAVGYARCAGPLGPCQDARENPALKSGPGLEAPGHETIFRFRGRSWIAFHGWRAGPPRHRALYIAPLRWVEDRPVIGPPLTPARVAERSQ